MHELWIVRAEDNLLSYCIGMRKVLEQEQENEDEIENL